MSGTFPYRNPRTGKTEQRPTEPSFFQKAYENAAYDESVDTQRAAYNKSQASNHTYSQVPDSMQGNSEE